METGIFDRLIGGVRAGTILEAFMSQADLGLVAPDGHLQPLEFYLGANAEKVRQSIARLGFSQPDTNNHSFVSGTMFWVRVEALRPILDANLLEMEFENECAQIDGTLHTR